MLGLDMGATETFKLDLPPPDSGRIWSLCSVEMPCINPMNGLPDLHCFLALTENDAATRRILVELHFIPVDADGLIPQDGSVFSKFLGPNAYRKKNRDLSELAFFEYAQGSPKEVLHLWNHALSTAAYIRSLKHGFVRGGCRSGAEGIIESLGYPFKTVDDIRAQWGLNAKLTDRLPKKDSQLVPDVVGLLTDFHNLYRKLDARRLG